MIYNHSKGVGMGQQIYFLQRSVTSHTEPPVLVVVTLSNKILLFLCLVVFFVLVFFLFCFLFLCEEVKRVSTFGAIR